MVCFFVPVNQHYSVGLRLCQQFSVDTLVSMNDNINSNDKQERITLKIYRQRLGLSQEALARKLDVSFRSIAEWENCRQIPRLDNAVGLASHLGISLETLCDFFLIDTSKLPKNNQ